MTRVRIPEVVVEGRRLGRHVRHDPRSLAYLAPEASASNVVWQRNIPILDQGQLGSCTGNATVGALGTGPLFDALHSAVLGGLRLDENLAVSIYSDAEKLDGGAGLPSEDQGSSGLSVAKVAKTRGFVSGYVHATSVDRVHGALQSGPVMLGTNWLDGMDNPDSEGIVKATGSVRGGHEYLCRGYDAGRDLWILDNSWGSSWGVHGSFCYDTPTLTALLADGGDATALIPVNAPAPTPNPTPIPVPAAAGRTFVMASDEEAAAVAAFRDGRKRYGACGQTQQALKHATES